jgi:glycosyltransferase involved in cell wall biosynthesis
VALSEVAGAAMERTAFVSVAEAAGSAQAASSKASTAPRSVTFVMPALNEETNIAHAVSELIPATVGLDDYEILIVNDGSTDRTGEIAEGLARDNPRIRVVHNPHNMGFGGAYKVGVSHARMPYVIMVPGDSNHPPDGVTPILDLIGQADIVVPYVSNPEVRGRKRMIISETYTRLFNLLFWQNLPYYNGLVLHRTALLRTIDIKTNGYAYQSEALVKLLRKGATTVTVAVPLAHSDPNTRAFKLKNVMRVGNTILRLMFRI